MPVVRLEGTETQTPQTPLLPATRLAEGARSADLDSGRAVSLTFADPLEVRDVLLLLFRGTPFSIVFEPAAKGTFIGELSDLTLRQALEAVLFPAGLDYDVKGPIIRVFPRRPQTRLFEVSHVDVKRAFQRRVRSLTSGDGSTAAADISTAVESDFFTQLGDGVRALLSPSGRLHIDRKAGVVQATDFADRLDQVGLFIETVSLRATRQVRLHARVLEVTLSTAGAIDWAAIANRTGLRIGPGAGIRIDDFDALLQAIGEFGPVRMIASPQMLAMNNEPAVMRVGSECAVFSAAPNAGVPGCLTRLRQDYGAAGQPSPSLEWTLTITPQIGADGIVHMSVAPTIMEPLRVAGLSASDHVVSVVEADTTVRVKGGDTVLISGLLRAADPREAPVAANKPPAKKELVILLTPTVVGAGSAPVAGTQ
jgi:type II secretory pathway component GspD/PulD (secretin)